MTKRKHDQERSEEAAGVNPGYAAFQIAHALRTAEEHADAETRARAEAKIAKWETVLRNIVTGSVGYGSRTPVDKVPAWATLEVVTGGFATGALLAAGPLQAHEQQQLERLGEVEAGGERRALNAHFLSEAGLGWLGQRLKSGCYDVAVPEEGALLVVAWLVERGHAAEARDLLEVLSPFFARLRFYPVPLEQPRRFGSRVHLQDVGRTLEDIQRIKPNRRILAQKEAVAIWAPFHDRVVALFLETVDNDWPCQRYPEGWAERALALLGEYSLLRQDHKLCGRVDRPGGYKAQLRAFLGRCATKPEDLSGREIGRIRLILRRYQDKLGAPDDPRRIEARQRQRAAVSAPTHHAIAGVVATRLQALPREQGLDDVSQLRTAVSAEEAARSGVIEGSPVPPSIQSKVERCLNETVEILIERGLITSGETLAKVLPQMTSGLRAAGITDPELRQLYAAIYRAFRRRRSLLLLNLEQQVQIEELPWVAAIDRFRSASLSSQELARQTLEELSLITLTAFPHVILPNKLLQELRALVKGAALDIPLVDELAADIFMGELSGKFNEAARRAADLLRDSLYERYYGIDFEAVRSLPKPEPPDKSRRSWWSGKRTPDALVLLCADRAGVKLGTWDPATNGMIIEQQQILTTQNLAALVAGLDLSSALRGSLADMARRCFTWICKRQQMKVDKWHARLIALKNTAYGWRQMIFYLSLLDDDEVGAFLGWSEAQLVQQGADFRRRFAPALRGLVLAAQGQSLDSDEARRGGARRFLGWSKERHWMLPEVKDV